MVKNIVLVVFLALSAGAWFYLDNSSRQDQLDTMQMRITMEQTRAKVQAQSKAQLEANLRMALADCQAEAEKAKKDFLILNRKPVRGKRDEFTTTQAVIDESEKRLANANAACWNDYDGHLSMGS